MICLMFAMLCKFTLFCTQVLPATSVLENGSLVFFLFSLPSVLHMVSENACAVYNPWLSSSGLEPRVLSLIRQLTSCWHVLHACGLFTFHRTNLSHKKKANREDVSFFFNVLFVFLFFSSVLKKDSFSLSLGFKAWISSGSKLRTPAIHRSQAADAE